MFGSAETHTFAHGYWDTWPLGESKGRLVEVYCSGHVWLHVSADTIQRNNQLSFAGVFFSQGITFCSFQLGTKFYKGPVQRIEVSPSRIVAYGFKVTALKHSSVICNLSKVLGSLYGCTKFKDCSRALSTWPGCSKSGTCEGLMLSVYSLAFDFTQYPPSVVKKRRWLEVMQVVLCATVDVKYKSFWKWVTVNGEACQRWVRQSETDRAYQRE